MDGAASTSSWLRWQAGMREGDARAAIEAGEATDLLSDTGAAWRDGEITSGAARSIVGARVDGHDEQLVGCEPVLLDLARRRTGARCTARSRTSASWRWRRTEPGLATACSEPTTGSRC
jgi:hypothetical protein